MNVARHGFCPTQLGKDQDKLGHALQTPHSIVRRNCVNSCTYTRVGVLVAFAVAIILDSTGRDLGLAT